MKTQEPSRDQEAWLDPEPLPCGLPAVTPFEYELLPRTLRPWIKDIAERIQCPPDYPAVAAMVALAGVVGRKVGIRPKRRDDWTVVANLWGIVIGRPGLMKTPAISEPLKVLKRLEAEAKASYEAAVRDKETDDLLRKAGKTAVENKIRKALKDGKDNDAKAIASAYLKDRESTPVRRRYLVNDSTVEKIGVILNENPNGVTVYRDELMGLLRSMEREGHEGARAFYLEAWNGSGRFTYDRIGRGTLDIEATTLSIIGAIQPGPLAEFLQATMRGGVGDDGFIQRFQLAVHPDCPTSWRNVDRWPNAAAKDQAWQVYRRLDELDPVAIGATLGVDDEIPYLRLDENAQIDFDGWRTRLEHRLRSGEEHPAMENHLAKYRSLIPSLALLIHLAEEPSGGPVSSTALRRAMRWGEYLETHARRLYGSVIQRHDVAARLLAAKIEDGSLSSEFTLRELYRNGWSGLSKKEDSQEAVQALWELNWLREHTELTGGKLKTTYRLNPKIFQTPGQKEPPKPTEAPSVSNVSALPKESPDVSIDDVNGLFAESTDEETYVPSIMDCQADGWGEI